MCTSSDQQHPLLVGKTLILCTWLLFYTFTLLLKWMWKHRTDNKSFILLDRWNKLSHDSSNSTIRIFTLSHHTKDICNPLQCKHMIQRHISMLENKQLYPPKKKRKMKKPAFCTKYLLLHFRSSCPEHCETSFHRWTTDACLLILFEKFRQWKVKIKDKPLAMIVFDIIIFFSKIEIVKCEVI